MLLRPAPVLTCYHHLWHQLQAKKSRGSLPKSYSQLSLISATVIRLSFRLQFLLFYFLFKYNIPSSKCTYHTSQGLLRNTCVIGTCILKNKTFLEVLLMLPFGYTWEGNHHSDFKEHRLILVHRNIHLLSFKVISLRIVPLIVCSSGIFILLSVGPYYWTIIYASGPSFPYLFHYWWALGYFPDWYDYKPFYCEHSCAYLLWNRCVRVSWVYT